MTQRRLPQAHCRGVLLAIVMAAACFRYQPASLSPAAGTRVRVVLKTPTSVVIAELHAEGQRLEIPSVLEASGVIVAAAADTISLRLGELRTISGGVAGVENRVALVPVQSIAAVSEKRLDTGRTLLSGAGLLLVGAGAALIVLVVIVTKAAGA
jgi:hypothetical protein